MTSSSTSNTWARLTATLLAAALQSGCGSGHATATNNAEASPLQKSNPGPLPELETADNPSLRARLLY